MSSKELDLDPYFASEAQETFVVGHRVYAVTTTSAVREGAEGVYEGRHPHFGAVISWDTPDGNGFRESVSFDAIRNLYR